MIDIEAIKRIKGGPMNRKRTILLPILALAACCLESLAAQPEMLPLAFHPTRTLEVGGLEGERLALWRDHRLFYIADDGYLIDGFENRPGTHPWQGEHLGKWLHAATHAYRMTGDQKIKDKMDELVSRLLATQIEDGYLGTYPEEARFMNVPEGTAFLSDDIPDEKKQRMEKVTRGGWDTWTFRYNIYGLLTYEKFFPNEAIVDCCRKMADLLIEVYGGGKHDITKYGTRKGISATTLLESIVMLYQRTGEKKYLDFAEDIVMMSEKNPDLRLVGEMLDRGTVVKPGEGKAYQLMANLLGYLQLYRCTGNADYIQAVEYAWNDIRKNHVTANGGLWGRKTAYNGNGECFAHTDAFDPAYVKLEGCSDTTWVQLCLHLFELTGDAKYFKEAEPTLINSIHAHQHPSGRDWHYYIYPNQNPTAYRSGFHCCGSSQPRALEMFAVYMAGQMNEAFCINSLAPASYRLSNRFGGGTLETTGNFPLGTTAEITLKSKTEKSFPLNIIVPKNCELKSVQVNGRAVTPLKTDNGFMSVSRRWSPGDKLTVELKFRLVATVQKGALTPPNGKMPGKAQNWVAFNYGPLTLGQCIETEEEMATYEPFAGMSDTEAMLAMLEKVPGTKIAFKVKGTDLTLVPFVSAMSRVVPLPQETNTAGLATSPRTRDNLPEASGGKCYYRMQ